MACSGPNFGLGPPWDPPGGFRGGSGVPPTPLWGVGTPWEGSQILFFRALPLKNRSSYATLGVVLPVFCLGNCGFRTKKAPLRDWAGKMASPANLSGDRFFGAGENCVRFANCWGSLARARGFAGQHAGACFAVFPHALPLFVPRSPQDCIAPHQRNPSKLLSYDPRQRGVSPVYLLRRDGGPPLPPCLGSLLGSTGNTSKVA